jgi:hypothetical protein
MKSFRLQPVVIEEEEEVLVPLREVPIIEEEEEVLIPLQVPIVEEEEPETTLGEDKMEVVEVEDPGTPIPIAVPLPFSYLYKIVGTSVVIDRVSNMVLGYHDDQYRVIDKKSREVEEVCEKYGLVYFHISFLNRILKSENVSLCSY